MRQIVGIDDSLDKVEPLKHDHVAIVHDENTSDVQLDVDPLLRLEEVKGSSVAQTTTHGTQAGPQS